MVSFQPSLSRSVKAIIIPLTEEELTKKRYSTKIPTSIRNIIGDLKGQFTARKNQLFPILYKGDMFLLVGLGKGTDLSSTLLRQILRRAFLSDYVIKQKQIAIIPNTTSPDIVSIVEAWEIGTYRWAKYKADLKKQRTASKLVIVAPSKKNHVDAVTVCKGVNLTRDLINDNADVTTSSFLEKKIRSITKGKSKFKFEVLGRQKLKQKGLGLHLAVNQGSVNEPKLVIVRYQGASKNAPYTALIGKGLTFDTGGLNLKPTGGIESMKMDMSGAAAVIGTLANVVALKPKKNIIFAVGLAENVTGAKSYKPGDVITGYAKKSVEVANTDAEGRLVLADAISYVIKNYKPKTVIDIATLTGACIVALGHDYTGLVSSDESLAQKLLAAADQTDDRAWPMPSYPELKESVSSQIADIRNLGFPKGAGGMITAAEFLRQFANGVKWAHLDIAGTAFVDGKERMYFGHGATGAGVRLLTRFCAN